MTYLLLAASVLGGCIKSPTLLPEERRGCLAGQILDFTNNHGADRRIYSSILCEKRDLYVYLPPGYDPAIRYPLIIWFHGAFGDESGFVNSDIIYALDRRIRAGCFPPVVVISADATVEGRNSLLARNAMFINGVSGRYEDHLMEEILPFVFANFSLRPERDAHALVGYSGGGLPAIAIGIKYRELFATVVSISGPINLRYSNCRGRYFDDFNPCTYRWATKYRCCQSVVKYYGGLLQVPAKFFIRPIYGNGRDVLQKVRRDNPADLIFSKNLQPGDLNIYIRYAGRDNFNFDAQAESFIWLARSRGIEITAIKDEGQFHTSEYCSAAQIRSYKWLAPLLLGPESDATSEAVPIEVSQESEPARPSEAEPASPSLVLKPR